MCFTLFLLFSIITQSLQTSSFAFYEKIPTFNYTGVSSQCSKDTQTWIDSLELFLAASEHCLQNSACNSEVIAHNLYAVQQLDAFGRLLEPGLLELRNTFNGDYQECQRVSGLRYPTNYCFMILTPKFKLPITSPMPYRSAVCMPNSCGKQDLTILYNQQLEHQVFTAITAYCAHREVEKGSAFWGFSSFLLFIALLAVTATITDYCLPSAPRTTLLQMLLSFSMWSNAGQVLSVKEQRPGFIKCLDCIRLLSMSWVVAGHSTAWLFFSETSLPLGNVGKHLWNQLTLNALLSVDTFFLLSGIVLCYLFFKQRPKKSTVQSPITWMLYYLHRYLRLTPSYMLFIGFFVVYAPYIQGPYSAWMMNALVEQAGHCEKNWWWNALYLNNFQPDQKEACYAISWYLSVDLQLYVIAPVVLVALYMALWKGVMVIILGCIGSVVATYVLYGVHPNMTIDSFRDYPDEHFTNEIYQKPWTRCSPYLIGMLVGYLIAVFGKRTIRLNWMINAVCWSIAFALGFTCLFANFDFDKGSHWSPFLKATCYSFTRIGWSIAVSWVIIANHFGWGGPINSFMSHPIWQPFGRLSYCAFIVHWMVLFYFLNVGAQPVQYFNMWQVYTHYAIPATCLSYFVAFFWSCLFEVPTLKLEKMMIESLFLQKSEKPSDDVKEVKEDGP